MVVFKFIKFVISAIFFPFLYKYSLLNSILYLYFRVPFFKGPPKCKSLDLIKILDSFLI